MNISRKAVGGIVFVVGTIIVIRIIINTFFDLGNSNSTTDGLQTDIQGSVLDQQEQNKQNENDLSAQQNEQATTPVAVEDNTNTNTDTKQSPYSNNEQESINQSKSVSVLFPPFYSQQQIETLSTLIKRDSGINTQGKRLQSWENYYVAVEQFIARGGSIDMIVMPSSSFVSAQKWGLSFTIPETLQRFYHHSFHEWMFNRDITVVPFALDPVVLYRNDELVGNKQFKSSTELLQFIATYQQENSVPVAPTLSSNTIPLLEENKLPFLHAHSLIGGFVEYGLRYSSLDWLLMVIPSNSVRDSSQKCEHESSVCLLEKGHTALTIGFLSEAGLYEQSLIQNDALNITDLPIKLGNDYPIIGRGIVTNKNTKHPSTVEKRLESFISLSIDTQSVPYSWNMFGPTYSMIQRQSINTLLQGVQQFKQTGTIIDGPALLFEEPFLEMVAGSISLREFMALKR